MTYRLSDEQIELRRIVRELAEEQIAPRAAEIDRYLAVFRDWAIEVAG